MSSHIQIGLPPTSQNPKEFAKLLKIYDERKPKNVLEIGTHEGGTLYYWLNNATPGTTVGSIDIQGIIKTDKMKEWAADRVTGICLQGNSEDLNSINWAKKYIGNLDWLFIDGGHSYKEVRADYENYGEMVKRGGIIAFHDILPQPPYKDEPVEVNIFWNELKKINLKMEEIIEDHDEWIIGPGIGIIYK
jgi:predicted O-methyltransferase YrrM